MGFYIRKSISAGPFRFNLSGSGVGMSVGVKGFRLGTGPRGNYVHMGRGGLYYRASLGAPKQRRTANSYVPAPTQYAELETPVPIEVGDIGNMSPSNGSDIVDQINEKLSVPRYWIWTLCLGGFVTLYLTGQPAFAVLSGPMMVLTMLITAALWWWDKSNRVVVILYDLADGVIEKFKIFSEEFEKVGAASRIWNVETAARTSDWKRNAGAGRLISRKNARLGYGAPSIVRTNVGTPCIVGGRHSLYFLPDVVLVLEGRRAGALTYDQLEILWSDTVFIEDEGVPSDSQVVGHTWRFVNKSGGPDRRFNNNRQIPRVLYQQMGIRGTGDLQKILHLSKVTARTEFDNALAEMRNLVRKLATLALSPPSETFEGSSGPRDKSSQPIVSTDSDEDSSQGSNLPMFVGVFLVTVALGIAALWLSGGLVPVATMRTPVEVAAPVLPAEKKVSPSFDCAAVTSEVLTLVCGTSDLAALDQELAAAYKLAMQHTSSPRRLRSSERNWIARRNNSAADVELLRNLYVTRIAELRKVTGLPNKGGTLSGTP